jgi:hypothetical protein
MQIRDLALSVSRNLGEKREFNHLRIDNIEYFLRDYASNIEYYKSPFEILADLEAQIKFENNPEEGVMCSYKPEGYAMFNLVDIKEEGNLRIVTYHFTGFVS